MNDEQQYLGEMTQTFPTDEFPTTCVDMAPGVWTGFRTRSQSLEKGRGMV